MGRGGGGGGVKGMGDGMEEHLVSMMSGSWCAFYGFYLICLSKYRNVGC